MGSKSCVCLGDETEVKSIILGERGEKRLQPVSSSRGQLFTLLQIEEKKSHSHFALSPGWEGLFLVSHFIRTIVCYVRTLVSPLSQRERTGFCRQRFSGSALEVGAILRRPI